MKSRIHSLTALCILQSAFCIALRAQPTNFTYQGVLTEGGTPANGIYDFLFVIYNGPDFGFPGISALQTTEAMDLEVSNGLFTAAIPFQSWVFSGEQRWLEVQVRTNDSGDYTGLLPWTEITPAPYAVRALHVTSNALMGDYGGPVNFSNPSNMFAGDGSGLTGVTLDGATAADFWRLGGNAGTSPGADFIGTTDGQALEVRVNNTRALKVENTVTTPNLIGGYSGNSVGSGNAGVVIAGGGFSGFANTVGNSSPYSAIGGGYRNTIGTGAGEAAISGGQNNTIGMNSGWTAIGGGLGNRISSNSVVALIAGGNANEIGSNSPYAVVVGGATNIVGGDSDHASIGGGSHNTLGPSSSHATIAGGLDNNIAFDSDYSVISGGRNNHVGDICTDATISGGRDNSLSDDSDASAIGGGYLNSIAENCYASTIGGGVTNNIQSDAWYATIPGGSLNQIGAGASYAFAAGRRAWALHPGSFVWADSTDTFVSSDRANQFKVWADGGVYLRAASSGLNPAALRVESSGGSSVAIHANQTSSDSTTVFVNRGSGDLIKGFSGATGGNLVFRVDNSGNALATSHGSISDRNAKENFEAVDSSLVLQKVLDLPVQEWSFKGDDARHMGPMAQDFYAAFGLGASERIITTLDIDGAALAAIQGLNDKVECRMQNAEVRTQTLERQLKQKATEIAELKQTVNELRQLVHAMNNQLNGGAR